MTLKYNAFKNIITLIQVNITEKNVLILYYFYKKKFFPPVFTKRKTMNKKNDLQKMLMNYIS